LLAKISPPLLSGVLDAHAHKFNKLGLARHAGSTLFRATTIDTSKSTCVCMGKYRMQKIEICLCIHHGKIYESYWKKLCTGIQKSADYEYRRSLLKGIRKGHRSKFKESIPLLSIVGALLTGTSAQQDYVVDHYISFYGYPVKVSHSALSCLQKLPTFKNWTALSPEK